MITISGALVKKLVNSATEVFSPISRAYYYDTPYSINSWGFKTIYYDNYGYADKNFTSEKISFVGRDANLCHSWGEGGPAQIPNGHDFLIRWLGYFRADFTGTYKFYLSADDGARINICTDSNRTVLLPSGLGVTYLLNLNPTYISEDSVGAFNSWETRNDIATFSGWVGLTEGYWYPIKIDYFSETSSSTRKSDIVLQYEEPTGVTNSQGNTSDDSIRKVVGAGIVNYPYEDNTWSGAGAAAMIGVETPNYYLELRDIMEISTDRQLSSVGQCSIKLPLGEDKYHLVKGTKDIYRYGTTETLIRIGRLIDVDAGFQTKCRYFDDTIPACSLDIAPVYEGGYYQPNLCSKVNPRCPWQRAMPGDYVKRFRGRIVSAEIQRDSDKSYLILKCEDNLYYLRKGINQNYPDATSYAMFNYAGKNPTPARPDGVGKPTAYDSFLLNEAFIDLCIKSGIDSSYLYSKQQLVASGINKTLRYVSGDRNIQGETTRLSRSNNYGNALYVGLPEDEGADSRYIWTQSFGTSLLDTANSISENYGYAIGCDVNGNMIMKTRDNPILYPASGLGYSGTKHRIPDYRAVAGHYVWPSGNTGHFKLPVQGSQFSIYSALEPLNYYWSWDVMRNEGVSTSGYYHGAYTQDELSLTYGQIAEPMGIGYADVRNQTWTWSLGEIVPHINFPVVQDLWVTFNPKYQFNADRISFKYKGLDLSTPIPGLEEWSSNNTVKADVYIGKYTVADDDTTPYEKRNVDISFTSSTQVASNIVIDDLFTPDPFDRWNEKVINFSTAYAFTSGNSYAMRIVPKLYVNGTEWTGLNHNNLMQNRTFRNFCRTSFPWIKKCILAGARVDTDASPNPIGYRIMAQPGDPYGVQDITWNNSTKTFDSNFVRNDRTAFPDLVFVDKDAVFKSYGFHVMVSDTDGNFIYESRNLGFANLPYGRQDYRFSTDGIDPALGYNPNVWTHYANKWVSKIPGMGELIPEANNFTIWISGLNIRLEAVTVSKQTSMAPKFQFSSSSNLFNMTTEIQSDDIRNDVVVVGDLKGFVQDPNTGGILNPNNPTFDYVFSRAVDLSSIGRFGVENSIGMSIPFIIHEPNIKDQEHADYLSFATLDRYRKLQNLVSFDGLAIPFLDIEDAISIADERYVVNTNNQVQWIESITETVNADKYDMNITSTPLPPWPSYVPKQPPNLSDFVASGKPQIVMNVAMTDTVGKGRYDALSSPHNTNYDPYESEGASINSDSANGYPPVSLRCRFTLLANCNIRACVKLVDGDNTDLPNGVIVGWLLGGEAEDTSAIMEKRDWGTYEIHWDGTDILGRSRTRAQSVTEGIKTELEGIYARNQRYYVHFEVESLNQDDHDVLGASRIYDTINLPTLGDNGLPLNPDNNNLGYQFSNLPTGSRGQVWKIAIGTRSQGYVRGNGDPSTNLLKWAFPGGTNNVTQIKGKQFTSLNDNLEVWLQPYGAGYFNNRSIGYKVSIEEGSLLCAPKEEFLQYNDGVVNDEYINGSLQPSLVSTTGEWAATNIEPSTVRSNDVGVSLTGSPARTNDEIYIVRPIFCQNRNRGQIPGVPELDRLAGFNYKMNEIETKITFNPMRYGLYFNQVDRNAFLGFEPLIYSNTQAIRDSLGNNVSLHPGYKVFCMVYMARWINVFFTAIDRSGRLITSAESWSDRGGFGLIPDGIGHPNEGSLAYRCIWVPAGNVDMTGNHPYMGYVKPETWVNSSDYSNDFVKRINIPGYTGLLDSELPTGTSIENHTFFIMHTDNPHGAMGDMANNNSVSYFRDNFAEFGFYAWPIWMYWKPVGSSSNYSIRTVLGTDSANFMGYPPFETIRGY